MAASDHGHGALAQFLEKEGELGDTLQGLRDRGWIGEVQFLPYSPSGPIKLEQGNRAVTLFELEELVEISRRGTDRYVVLVAAPCGQCGATKESALKPLLCEPALRLWTHLVTDTRTASRVISLP